MEKKASWIKLGFYKGELIALLNDEVVVLRNGEWKRVVSYFQPGSFIPLGMIPSENIRIVGNSLYFIKEYTRMRDCHLYEIDLTKDNSTTNFIVKCNLNNNYSTDIICYTVTKDNELYVSGERGDDFFIKEKNGKAEIYMWNNKIRINNFIDNYKLKTVDEIIVHFKGIIQKENYQLIIASNGIFKLENYTITPIVDFVFRIRCFAEISENKFFIGEMFGGVYILDANSNSITAIKEDRKTMKELDIRNIGGNNE